MKKLFCCIFGFLTFCGLTQAQVLLSGGLTYSQNFNTLSNAPINTNPGWTDNTTILGWYASRAFTAGTTSTYGPYAYTSYRIDAGTATGGLLYSYGTNGVNSDTDRALGSLGSGTPKTNVFGLRLRNDTGAALNNVLVSYTGEEWRNGGGTANILAFSYQVSATPFTSPIGIGGTDGAPNNNWTAFTALDFVSPIFSPVATTALDGNATANRIVFSNILLAGVTLNPGEELFLRWLDIDDSGSDHGLAVDDLTVSLSAVPEPSIAVLTSLGLIGLFYLRRRS